MEGYLKLFLIAVTVIDTEAFSAKTGALLIPEKIIGGVIDIVQSHKNKPIAGTQQSTQQTYPQYPQYSSTQTQGYYQNQQTSQGQYYQNGFQNGNYQSYPATQNFQGQTSGQYQNQYTPSHQYPNQQFQNNGQTSQFQNNNGQTSQFQNTNGASNQFQNNQNNQFQGQHQYPSSQYPTGQEGSSQISQGVLVPGKPGNGQGPTCVCQAWTKPPVDGKSNSVVYDEIDKSKNI